MQKIACIFSFKKSSWISCQKIVFNIHKTYHLHKDYELLNFNYSADQSQTEVFETAEAIAKADPDVLVFMDHAPHPLLLFQQLFSLLGQKKPKIFFHVFGDFTLFYSLWEKMEKALKGFEVEFIVASDRQKILIDKLLSPPMVSSVCPFPVDESEFFYNPALRAPMRKEWGLKDSDIALVFTGRLSRQKRIHTLIKSFSALLTKTKATHVHLFLYGMFDNVADQFMGLWETENEYFRKVNRLYKGLPEEIQSKIHFMGNVPNLELRSVYQGADTLVNLSVHNDEDYGMSVAETLCSGLPAIMTDWGGLASFDLKEIKGATTYIPVTIGLKNKKVDTEKFQSALEQVVQHGPCLKREEISKLALKKFGVKGCADITKKILEKKTSTFEEFGPLFRLVTKESFFSATPYLNNTTRNINQLYRDLYSSYVRNN